MPTVSGRVTTPDGSPVRGVHVYAVPADGGRARVSGHTDRDGCWALELPAGRWTVREVGHRRHDVVAGDEPVDATTVSAAGAGEAGPAPDRDAIAAVLARRRAEGA